MRKSASIVAFVTLATVPILLLLLMATSMLFAAGAQELTSTVTASVGVPSGTRILQPVNAPSALVFTDSSTASTPFSASVVESTADGVADWYVTVKAGDFSRTGGGGSIPASNLSYSSLSNTATGLGALSGTIQAGTNGALNGAGQTMFKVAGEVSGTFPGYTGTYTGSGNLTLSLPAGTSSGIYVSTVTVTMIA